MERFVPSPADHPAPGPSVFACFVGRANAGKSTLTNVSFGQKVAITSNRPQTPGTPCAASRAPGPRRPIARSWSDTPGLQPSAGTLLRRSGSKRHFVRPPPGRWSGVIRLLQFPAGTREARAPGGPLHPPEREAGRGSKEDPTEGRHRHPRTTWSTPGPARAVARGSDKARPTTLGHRVGGGERIGCPFAGLRHRQRPGRGLLADCWWALLPEARCSTRGRHHRRNPELVSFGRPKLVSGRGRCRARRAYGTSFAALHRGRRRGDDPAERAARENRPLLARGHPPQLLTSSGRGQ